MRAARPARTPGISESRRLFAAHAAAERLGMPVDEVLGAQADARAAAAREAPPVTRRSFLLGGAGLLAGAALAGRPSRSAASPVQETTSPRIAIVGAGLAGLRCAHVLWTHPGRAVSSTVYEANPVRAGGRCWTLRGFFAGDVVTEHGGAFINSKHRAIRRLAAGLGLQEEVVNGGDLPSGHRIYWIDGAYYTPAEGTADWSAVGYRAFSQAALELESVAGERRLDSMSVPQWLDSTDIGSGSRLGKLLLAHAVAENGGDPGDQSALDLIESTAAGSSSSLPLSASAYERFHVVGGNDQIVTGMLAQLPGDAVQHEHELVALRENADRTITLSFQTGSGTVDVTADHVVLALPFSTLRQVDLSRSGLSASKLTVIHTLGMGSNAKIHVELGQKTWPGLGFSGTAYGEWDSFCCAWDDSVPRGAGAQPALLLGFPGASVSEGQLTGAPHGVAPEADVSWFLRLIEPVYPGTSAQYTGRAYEDHWATDPWTRGAYSYNRVGQAASFGRIAAASQGRIHFAGEHTSIAVQGFLEGAVRTGEHAARKILRGIA
jgi:monoamine oxidase